MTSPTPVQPRILVDADACPVKDEIYRVAERHGIAVTVVAGGFLRIPQHPMVTRVAAGSGLDAADDWIAAHADASSIVITADIPLADRCVKAGALVLSPAGKVFDRESIGLALAVRNLMTDLREGGQQTGGPRGFSRADRSNFLSALDQGVRRIRRSLAAAS